MTKDEILRAMDEIADLTVSTYIDEKLEDFIHSAICSYVDAHFDPQSMTQVPGIQTYVQSSVRNAHGISPLMVPISVTTGTDGSLSYAAVNTALNTLKPSRKPRHYYSITVRPNGKTCDFLSISHRSAQAIQHSKQYPLLAPRSDNPQFLMDTYGFKIFPNVKYDVNMYVVMEPLVCTDTVECELPVQTKRWIATRAVLNYAIGSQNQDLVKAASELLLTIAI